MSHFACNLSSFQFLEKPSATTLKLIFFAKFNSIEIGKSKLCSVRIAKQDFGILIIGRMQVELA